MKLDWETVVIVLGILAGAIAMKLLGQDPAIILSSAAALLGLFNLNKSSEIKTNVNGNMSALIAELASYRHTLADMAKTTVPAGVVTAVPAAPAVAVPAVPAEAAPAVPATVAASVAATAASVAATAASSTAASVAADGQAAA